MEDFSSTTFLLLYFSTSNISLYFLNNSLFFSLYLLWYSLLFSITSGLLLYSLWYFLSFSFLSNNFFTFSISILLNFIFLSFFYPSLSPLFFIFLSPPSFTINIVFKNKKIHKKIKKL
jgi:hypothetical protein